MYGLGWAGLGCHGTAFITFGMDAWLSPKARGRERGGEGGLKRVRIEVEIEVETLPDRGRGETGR